MMLDFASSAEVDVAPPPLQFADRDHGAIKSHPRHQATHWTRRLQDPLGTALLRLIRARTTLDEVDSAAPSWEGRTELVAHPDSQSVDETEALRPELSPGCTDLPVVEPAVTGTDRRGFPRRPSECSVTLIERHETSQLTPQEIDWWLQSSRTVGRLLDISQTGLCLQLDREIAHETEVLLRISNHQLDRYVDATAKVIHSNRTGRGQFSVHCRALHDLTLAELQDLAGH